LVCAGPFVRQLGACRDHPAPAGVPSWSHEPDPAREAPPGLEGRFDQRRSGRRIKLSAWGKYLGDATVTAAVLDRLAMTAIRLGIDGPSYRQHLAHLRAETTASASDFGPDLE